MGRNNKVTKAAILLGSQGRGTNMSNIIRGSIEGVLPIEVTAVVSPRDGTPAVEAARGFKVPVVILSPADSGYASQLTAALRLSNVDLVCLAGYMTLLPVEVVRAYKGMLLNIHPALLPKFGGKGMYGKFVHEAVLAAGETESGCTVHQVTERYDEGEIITQVRCPVLPGDTVETLSERVRGCEAQAYPVAIRRVLEVAAG